MSLLAAAHLAITAAYCALLWVVQIVVYPQFHRVPATAFADYHREHCARTGWVVGPLFVAEGLTALALAWILWDVQPFLQTASIALFLTGHGITFALFVPLHRQLQRGPVTKDDLARAVRLNWLRVGAAMARMGVVLRVVVTA
jgi:hypothetical protein